MAGSGALKRKSIQKRLREIRAAKATGPLEWLELPGWVLGAGSPSILATVGPHGDDITLAADVSREEYLTAVAAGVEADDLGRQYRDPDQAEASWLRFQLYRDHDVHGAGERCWRAGTCHVETHRLLPPSDPPSPQPTVPATEHYGHEGGTNRRSSPETWTQMEDRHDEERQRLLRIANAAPIRYFT
jgi:hypothetical protein